MKILREIIAVPIFILGVAIIVISCFIAGKDYSNDLITRVKENL